MLSTMLRWRSLACTLVIKEHFAEEGSTVSVGAPLFAYEAGAEAPKKAEVPKEGTSPPPPSLSPSYVSCVGHHYHHHHPLLCERRLFGRFISVPLPSSRGPHRAGQEDRASAEARGCRS